MQPALAFVPDLPWFSEGNFTLYARIRRQPMRMHHLRSAAEGIHSFDGYNYILMTEHEQGMSWTTEASNALNQIIVYNPKVFRLVDLYQLPNGDGARLYYLEAADSRQSAVGSRQRRLENSFPSIIRHCFYHHHCFTAECRLTTADFDIRCI